jgi:hypothetical protein
MLGQRTFGHETTLANRPSRINLANGEAQIRLC